MKYVVTLNGKNYEVEVEETRAVVTSVTDAPEVCVPPAPKRGEAAASSSPPLFGTAAENGTKIVSPAPGTILAVNKARGDSVEKGETVMILEAMKMENEIVSPVSGVIKQIFVQKGSTVETDFVLAVVG